MKHSLDTTYFSAVKPEDVPLDPPDMTDSKQKYQENKLICCSFVRQRGGQRAARASFVRQCAARDASGAQEEKGQGQQNTHVQSSSGTQRASFYCTDFFFLQNTITGSMLKGFTFEHHGPREQLLQHFTEAELLSPSVRNIVDSFIASNQEARDKKAQNSIVNAFDPPSFSSTASSTSSDSNL